MPYEYLLQSSNGSDFPFLSISTSRKHLGLLVMAMCNKLAAGLDMHPLDNLAFIRSLANNLKLVVIYYPLLSSLVHICNRPFSYSKKEPGSSVIFIHFIRSVRPSGVRASITSLLCTFKNSTKCIKMSFDSDSCSKWLKGKSFDSIPWVPEPNLGNEIDSQIQVIRLCTKRKSTFVLQIHSN